MFVLVETLLLLFLINVFWEVIQSLLILILMVIFIYLLLLIYLLLFIYLFFKISLIHLFSANNIDASTLFTPTRTYKYSVALVSSNLTHLYFVIICMNLGLGWLGYEWS